MEGIWILVVKEFEVVISTCILRLSGKGNGIRLVDAYLQLVVVSFFGGTFFFAMYMSFVIPCPIELGRILIRREER